MINQKILSSKKLILRGIWGQTVEVHDRIINRIKKVQREAEEANDKLFSKDNYIVLCFGRENYDNLSRLGYQTKLIYDHPFLFDPRTEQYRHKLYCYEYAFDKLEADEILWLDWDCTPKRNVIIEDLWKYKSDFAANLMTYNVRKCHWRTEHMRKLPNGGYLYMQKHLIEGIIRAWETLEDKMNDEVAYAKYLDKRDGDFDIERYKELYEPWQCKLQQKEAYEINKDNIYFKHNLGQNIY